MSRLKIDGALMAPNFAGIGEKARHLEDLGYDGLFSFEGPTEPFTPLYFACEHTARIELVTGVAIAFARNPMILAQTAHELQRLSGGRFRLGLGSQVKPHIERRFSETWSHPVRRMREYVAAVRAIWASWNEKAKLDFRGEFYTHTLMTPIFDPGAVGEGPPPIILGGVGPKMTALAGEVADGLLLHPFATPKSMDAGALAFFAQGLAKSGRSRDAVEIAAQVMVATGDDDEQVAAARSMVRYQIAFYGSTPAYRGVLDVEGWSEAHVDLHRLSKEGRWEDMAAVVDDTMLERIALCGAPSEVGAALRERFAGRVDRVGFTPLTPLSDAAVTSILDSARP